MTGRITRNIRISLPGGRTSAESVATIIDTIFSKGLTSGERVDSILSHFGDMGDLFIIEVAVSGPPDSEAEQMVVRDLVDDRRR
jgi:hypothetical protein